MTYSDEEILRRLSLGEDSAWAFKQVEFSGDRPTGRGGMTGQTRLSPSPTQATDAALRRQPGFRQGGGGGDGRFPAAFHLTSTSHHYLTKFPMKKNIYKSFVKKW